MKIKLTMNHWIIFRDTMGFIFLWTIYFTTLRIGYLAYVELTNPCIVDIVNNVNICENENY